MADRYTKITLTVIAACLVIIAFRGQPIATRANAQRGPVHLTGPVHVIIDSVSEGAYQFAVPVRITQQP
jgi:hypothetical protein